MKKILGLMLLAACFCHDAKAQAWAYSLASIPETIKLNASVITHLENIDVEIEDVDKLHYSVHKIYTVLDGDRKDALYFAEHTSKYVALDDAEVKVFDASGKQVGKYKKKDMITTAVGEGLIEDGYLTYFRIPASSFPVTIEMSYDLKYKGTFLIPAFRYITPKEGVIESNYTAKVPASFALRYKPEHSAVQPAVSQFGNYKTYKWTVKNLAPMDFEEGSSSDIDKYPHIKIAANQFSYYGKEGSFASWQTFGAWLRDLYNGLDVLPPDRQQFFNTLVQGAATDREKIARIYNYLQQNFRYVSIQLGIGGIRPFSAEFTDKKKYGDCKGLSNYMKAALKAVGITSHVAIINASYDAEPVDPEFPSNDFNHVILCVPGQKDSIWLECTSNTAAFAELGAFTENRYALLVTDNGGALVPTPRSSAASNTFSTFSTVTMSDDLSAITETLFKTKGSYRQMIDDIFKQKRDDQKETIVNLFGFKQPDDFLFSKKDVPAGTDAKLELAIDKLPQFNAGSKLFISPRIYKIISKSLPKAENRQLDYFFYCPYEKTDTTVFKLLAGMKPDVLPGQKDLKCNYASYQSNCWFNEKENAIYSATSLVLKKHRIAAADYGQVKAFFDSISEDDSQKIVIIKSPTEKKAF